MIDYKKRQLIKYVAALPLLTTAVSALGAVEPSQNTRSEALHVLDEWLKNMPVTPSEYIFSRKILAANSFDIKAMSADDFRSGRTLHVNGVVLSCTEAALISELANCLS